MFTEDLAVPLVYDDRGISGIFAVDKPAGIDVMHFQYKDTGYPRLWEMLKKEHGGAHSNRIDRWTSGIVMCALDSRGQRYLKGLWSQVIRKHYLAVIPTPDWDAEFVELSIDGKDTQTSFTVLSEDGEGWSLVDAEMVRFGATHQIRRAAKALGHPIAGDARFVPELREKNGIDFASVDSRLFGRWAGGYGREEGWGVQGGFSQGFNQFLHSWRMDCVLPDSDFLPFFETEICAPAPLDFRVWDFDWDFVDSLGKERVGLEVLSLSPLSVEERKWDGKPGFKMWKPSL